MVGPPSYVKAVSVKNTTPHPVRIIATFGSPEQEADGNMRVVHTKQLAPQAQLDLGEEEYNMGTWTAVAPLWSLEAEHDVPSDAPMVLGKALYTPNVSGIVAVLHAEIQGPTDLTASSGTPALAIHVQE